MNDIYKFNPDEILSPDEEVIHEQNKMIERLQEQLKDAEYILDEMGWADRGLIDDYFEKWGVK